MKWLSASMIRLMVVPLRTKSDVGGPARSVRHVASLRPSLVECGPEPRTQLQPLELPLAADLDVLFVVARGAPGRLFSLGEGARLEQVPDARRAIAVHLYYRIHHVVDGEVEHLRDMSEQAANRFSPSKRPNLSES